MLTVSDRKVDAELPARARNLLNLSEWLAGDDANGLDDAGFTAAIGRRLREAGFCLDRLVLHAVTLHPGYCDRAIAWSPGEPVEIREGETAFRAALPVKLLSRVLEERRLQSVATGEAGFADWENSDVLTGRGLKHIVVAPLFNSDGPFSAFILATSSPAGFPSPDLDFIERLMKPLRSALELRLLRKADFSLLDTYIGTPTPQRLFAGRIRADEIETVEAALLLFDVENSSAFSRIRAADKFGLLKRRFDHLSGPILANGGMIVRATETVVLAIFPAAEPAISCHAALDAAVRGLTSSSREKIEGGPRSIAALHFGQITYGSLTGGRFRELTLLGPDIDLIRTIRDSAKAHDEPIAMSELFGSMAGVQGMSRRLYNSTDRSGAVHVYALQPEALSTDEDDTVSGTHLQA